MKVFCQSVLTTLISLKPASVVAVTRATRDWIATDMNKPSKKLNFGALLT